MAFLGLALNPALATQCLKLGLARFSSMVGVRVRMIRVVVVWNRFRDMVSCGL